MSNHEGHGSGSKEAGPDDSDCSCRGGPEQGACANAGCGFCSAAELITEDTPKTEESKELTKTGAVIGERAEDPPDEIFVYAENPQQMLSAQAQLISWAERKIRDEKAEFDDLSANHEHAIKNRWRTAPLKRACDRAKERVEFYEKVKAALEAGYCIIPNLPGDVFAVRTTRKKLSRKVETVNGTWGSPGSDISKVESNRPRLGEGKYVSDDTEFTQHRVVVKHEPGKSPEYGTRFIRKNFKEVDFPFAMAKPAILSSTSKAMALKVFDEMVVVANRELEPRRSRRSHGDPMVVGRIFTRNGYNRHTISFLINWFIDTRDL